jgi:hypothetical protein
MTITEIGAYVGIILILIFLIRLTLKRGKKND